MGDMGAAEEEKKKPRVPYCPVRKPPPKKGVIQRSYEWILGLILSFIEIIRLLYSNCLVISSSHFA